MKRSDYLYGVPGSYFKDMKYEDVLKIKIKRATDISRELSEHLHGVNRTTDYQTYQRLNERLIAVLKAIEFNKNLLDEMYDRI